MIMELLVCLKTAAYHIYKEFRLLTLCYETARENKTLVTIKKTFWSLFLNGGFSMVFSFVNTPYILVIYAT